MTERKIHGGIAKLGDKVRALYISAGGRRDYQCEVVGFTPKKIRVKLTNGHIELRANRDLRKG